MTSADSILTQATMCRFQPFDGAFNFRDAGGYKTESGQEVKRGVIFRSDALSGLTGQDLTRLASLRIGLLFDLRESSERERAPNRLPAAGRPDVINLPIWPVATTDVERAILEGSIREFSPTAGEDGPDTPCAMRNFYRSYVRDRQQQWAAMLQRLSTGSTMQILIHCAGGKDRTGVGIALLLRALGVSEQIVLEDYLLTNVAVDQWIAVNHPDGLPAYFHSVMVADLSYLKASFTYIDTEWGSLDEYLRKGLGLSDLQRMKLCASFLN